MLIDFVEAVLQEARDLRADVGIALVALVAYIHPLAARAKCQSRALEAASNLPRRVRARQERPSRCYRPLRALKHPKHRAASPVHAA